MSLHVAPRYMVGMKAIGLLLLVLFCVAVFLYLRRGGSTAAGFVTTRDFPALCNALQQSGREGSFWVVLVPGTARADGCAANLQYSIEDGVLGADWVLIAERNIEDKDHFLAGLQRAGARVTEKEGNAVRYLRATGAPDLAAAGQELLHRVYDVNLGDDLQLIVTGFEWRRNASATRTIGPGVRS